MKKLLLYSLFSLSLLAVPSCSKDKEDEPTTIPVSSLTLDNTSITIVEGETFTLTATVTPDNATNKTVSWTTSDAAVATVSDGKVYAVKEGEATITAKAGEKSTECKVSVKSIIFTVTFDSDGGSWVSPQNVENGKTATYPKTPYNSNLYFKGWYIDDKEYDFSTPVTSDITLKAHWWLPDNLYKAKAFSVSKTKQVYFSSGNLQYHCKNKEWRFAPLQYDAIDSQNRKISNNYDGYIDLFAWGTSDNPTLASTRIDDYDANFTDWGTKIDGGNVWRTLTLDEWTYILEGRKDASEKYGVAEVAGIKGLVLLPDSWILPESLVFNSGVLSLDFDDNLYKEKNQYSSVNWQKMESAGAVFLPAACTRYGDIVGGGGFYWSSSIYGSICAYALEFNANIVEMFNEAGRFNGMAVRLVRSLE